MIGRAVVLVGLLALGFSGCVKSVPGYDGPRVTVDVQDSTATIEFTFPSAGWEAVIDESRVSENTAFVYVTARNSGMLAAQVVTTKQIVFRKPGETFQCCEIFVKAAGSSHSGDHVPAAENCQ
ncbi:MAG: hypothetical protein MK116_11025 [Phycisphaerales bacterium]|nr:hypothetical protein [Phycisphaerales bacterium]